MDFESAIQTFAQAWMSANATNLSQASLKTSKVTKMEVKNGPDVEANAEVYFFFS